MAVLSKPDGFMAYRGYHHHQVHHFTTTRGYGPRFFSKKLEKGYGNSLYSAWAQIGNWFKKRIEDPAHFDFYLCVCAQFADEFQRARLALPDFCWTMMLRGIPEDLFKDFTAKIHSNNFHEDLSNSFTMDRLQIIAADLWVAKFSTNTEVIRDLERMGINLLSTHIGIDLLQMPLRLQNIPEPTAGRELASVQVEDTRPATRRAFHAKKNRSGRYEPYGASGGPRTPPPTRASSPENPPTTVHDISSSSASSASIPEPSPSSTNVSRGSTLTSNYLGDHSNPNNEAPIYNNSGRRLGNVLDKIRHVYKPTYALKTSDAIGSQPTNKHTDALFGSGDSYRTGITVF